MWLVLPYEYCMQFCCLLKPMESECLQEPPQRQCAVNVYYMIIDEILFLLSNQLACLCNGQFYRSFRVN